MTSLLEMPGKERLEALVLLAMLEAVAVVWDCRCDDFVKMNTAVKRSAQNNSRPRAFPLLL